MSFGTVVKENMALQQQCSVRVFNRAPSNNDDQNESGSNSKEEDNQTPEEVVSVETRLQTPPDLEDTSKGVDLLQYLTKRDAKGNVKVRNRTYWVVGMLVLGTCYMLINWINFVELSQSSHYHGLLVGPPVHAVWLSLLIFTATGTITFTLESANTVSYMFSGGSTQVPLMFDVTLSILLVHIPLNVLNYCVAYCRGNYMTNLQSLSCAFSILFIFTRMLWFAHIEGRHEDIPERSKNLFMISCAFYAIAMAFPITNWRSNKPPSFQNQDLSDISLYLLNNTMAHNKMGPFLSYSNSVYYQEHENVEYLVAKPNDPLADYKVADLENIANGSSSIFMTDFSCTDIYKSHFEPCEEAKAVKFKFQYSEATKDGPYGHLRYNYGIIPISDEACIRSNETFPGTWKLYFFIKTYKRYLNGTIEFKSEFWDSDCLHPQAIYDETLAGVC